jgi:D,D-heptose 1,7-bisphosphate phosphatase
LLKQAVFLVGGENSGSERQSVPAAARLVGGRPFLSYLVDTAARHGLSDLHVLAREGVDVLQREWGPGSAAAEKLRHRGIRLGISNVLAAGGSARALARVRETLDEMFLLICAENFFDFNWLDLLTLPGSGWQARLALRHADDARGRPRVVLDSSRIAAFEAEGTGAGLVYGGVGLLRRDVLDLVSSATASLDDLFVEAAAQGLLSGRRYERPFVEVTEGGPEGNDTAMAALWRRPAVFFDRDGVLNVDHGYVHRLDDFEWIPGARQAIKRFNDAGYLVFVVSNQSGVARGLYVEEDIHRVHAWMAEELQSVGAHIDCFEFCPFHPEGTIERYRQVSPRRKPGPGMLLDCLAAWPVKKEESLLIGDRPSDIEAAEAAGIPGYLFAGGDLLKFVEALPHENGAPSALAKLKA